MTLHPQRKNDWARNCEFHNGESPHCCRDNIDFDITYSCIFKSNCSTCNTPGKPRYTPPSPAPAGQEIRDKVLKGLKKDLQGRFIPLNNQWSKGRNSGLRECCNIIDEYLTTPTPEAHPELNDDHKPGCFGACGSIEEFP